jgi:Na+/melibiose symporter-like transporter
MVSRLVGSLGFPWTMRAMAFTVLGALVLLKAPNYGLITDRPIKLISIATVEARTSNKAAMTITKRDVAGWYGNDVMMSAVVGTWIGWLGYWVPFNYIGEYGLAKGASFTLAEDLVVIMNATGAIGKIIIPALGARYGMFNVYIVNTLIVVILTLANWIPAQTNAVTIIFSSLFGFFAGAGLPMVRRACVLRYMRYCN